MATVVRKQPAEKLLVSIDFTDKLDDTDITIASIDTLTATAVGLVEGSSAVVLSAQEIVGQTVAVMIDGGTSGEEYAVRCIITDSIGQEHEGDGTVRVVSIGSATIVVEDGSIVTGANSYADVATADAYLRLRGRASTWDTLSQAEKAGRLVMASAYLDATMSWRGDPVEESHTMQWPRSGVLDRNGYEIDDDVVPTALVHATIEVAMVGDFTTEASRVTTEERVGDIAVKYAPGSDVTQGASRYRYAMSLLTGLARGGAYSATVLRA